MDNNNQVEASGNVKSRRKFLSSLGMAAAAAVTGSLLADKVYGSSVTGSVYGQGSGLTLEGSGETIRVKHYRGTLDGSGNILFTHGLGASLPANVLLINAFVKLQDGRARNVSVDYVDQTHIAVSVGLPGAPVRVALFYAESGQSW